MKSTIKIVLGSLVGALAIHGALTACGAGNKSANAQTTPTSCTTWQVATVAGGNSSSPTSPDPVPTGWEPFAWLAGNNGFNQSTIVIRQCAP
jgi:ABC-type transport system substrate-binding protein